MTHRGFRNYCYTLNNYTELIIIVLKKIKCKYHIIGKEIAPKTGTPHLQGFIMFKNTVTLKSIRKKIKGANISNIDGTPLQNVNYCSKTDPDFWETGSRPTGAGSRNDLSCLSELVQKGKCMRNMISDGDISNYQGIRMAERIITYFEPKRRLDCDIKGYWLYGKTGIGKTRLARYLAGSDYYNKPPENKWWDGYDAHKVVIIDDYRHNTSLNFSTLLRIADRYSCKIECKGGSRQLQASTIILTSSGSINKTFKYIDDNLSQMYRRFTVINMGALQQINKSILKNVQLIN